MLLLPLIAGAGGIVIGWLFWGTLLRRSQARALDLQQRVSKLNGFPHRLTHLESTHAAFVASKNEEGAKYRARVAELEEQLTDQWIASVTRMEQAKVEAALNLATVVELRRDNAGKEQEVRSLQYRLADAESAIDPKREILLTAKNAELKHLRSLFNSLYLPFNREELARCAYGFAEARGFKGGTPAEDWLRAERDSYQGRLVSAWESTRPPRMF